MPIVLSNSLHQQEAACTVPEWRDLVGTVYGDGIALARDEPDALCRVEQFDLDHTFKTISRVGDDGVVMPWNHLT